MQMYLNANNERRLQVDTTKKASSGRQPAAHQEEMKAFFSSSSQREKEAGESEVSSLAASFSRSPNRSSPSEPSAPHHVNSLPISMQLMRPFAGLCCQECGAPQLPLRPDSTSEDHDDVVKEYDKVFSCFPTNSAVSPMVVAPIMHSSPSPPSIIAEYIEACQLYGCDGRINAGVLATLRFSLPTLRVTGDFHDADMLALSDIFIRHGNGALRYIQRLDFTIAAKEGKLNGKRGFRSHGGMALAKLLQATDQVQEVRLSKNKIGPYGATAIFLAASTHPSLSSLIMRRCRIMERGGLAFTQIVCQSKECTLKHVDLSSNRIGLRGSIAIEQELSKRKLSDIAVDLEGNLVFQEIMNGITHGVGVLFAFVGSVLLSNRVKDLSTKHVVSCAVYSTSLIVLYTSSTLYHSFFSMQNTKYVFEVLDKCAIYILIAGSYTPFLQVAGQSLGDLGKYLLAFIWTCCVCGITVEAFYPLWAFKGLFSLAMYLGMGWSCVVCMPELVGILPSHAVSLLVLGGVGYTAGVPFFVRNNNLDHSIFHLFVLAGSMFHWFGIYWYLPELP